MSEAEVDWRPFCSPIRDQGGCGSCTAFGTISAWEANIKIKQSKEVDLSEADLFFCSGGTCELGNTMDPVLNRAIRGVATEECCPYVDKTRLCGMGRCSEWWKTGVKLEVWHSITDIEQMKDALFLSPLVGVMAVHESFLHYVDGIYHNLGEQDQIVGYHCISIVGYSESKKAWLLRNSWGTGWGMKGYCWIQYGDSEIDEIMYSLNLSDEEPKPDEPICSYARFVSKIPLVGWSMIKLYRKIRKLIFGIEAGIP